MREVLVSVLFHPAQKHAVHDQSGELDYLIRKHASLTPPRRLSVDRLGHARWVAAQHSRAGMHGRAAALYLHGAIRHRSPGNVLRALDALGAKRPSSALARLRREPPAPPAAAPAWLQRCPLFERVAVS